MAEFNKIVKRVIHKTWFSDRSNPNSYNKEVKELNFRDEIINRFVFIVNDDEEKLIKATKIKYDKYGSVLIEQNECYYKDGEPEVETTEYEYGYGGKLLKSTYRKSENALAGDRNGYTEYQYIHGVKFAKKYDDKGVLYEIAQYDGYGHIDRVEMYSRDMVFKTQTNTYDSSGNLIEKSFQWNGSYPWNDNRKVDTPILISRMEYDKSGNQTAYFGYSEDGTVHTEYHDTYDENNNCIYRTMKSSLFNRETEEYSLKHEETIEEISESDSQIIVSEPSKQESPSAKLDNNLLSKANSGDPDAMVHVACNYYNGDEGFPKDDSQAYYWSKEATKASPDYAFAWTMLGRCYQFGVGTQEDVSLAIEAYKMSAELGDADGMYCLAEIYYFDAPDAQKHLCIPWLEKAHFEGNVLATALLGSLYKNGEFVTKNLDKGIELLNEAAKKGDPQAARLLAEVYWNGTDLPESITMANKYWTLAVKNGEDDPKALLYAGLAWFYGIGVEKDFIASSNCLEQNSVDDEANAILGVMMFEGVGGPVNRVEGEKRLRKAIDGTSEKFSLQSMNNLALYLYTASERLQEAIELFEKAAVKGNVDAQVNLGKAYYEGKGVPQNEDKAIYYFKMAAAQGSSTAIENLNALGKSFETGKKENNGVTNDPPERKHHPIRGAIIGYFIGGVIGMIAGPFSPVLGWICVIAGVVVGIIRS